MFDLNQAVRRWQESLRLGGAHSPEDLEELESHLHDEVSCLRQSGISDEEAFLLAARRLGSPAALATESAKANPRGLWQYRLYWMAAGTLLYLAVGWTMSVLASGARLATLKLGFDVDAWTLWDLGMMVGHWAVLLILGWLAFRFYRQGAPAFRLPAYVSRTSVRVALFLVMLVLALAGSALSSITFVVWRNTLTQIGGEGHVPTWWRLFAVLPQQILPILVLGFFIMKQAWARQETIWEEA